MTQETVFDFQAFADDYVENNQKEWGHDRSKSLGSSSAFGCIRKAWYDKHDTEKDEDYEESWGAMERGNTMEDHWFVPVMMHGIRKFFPTAKIYGMGANQTTLIDGLLSSTPDGFVTHLPRNCLEHMGIPDIGQCPGCPEGYGSLLTEAKSIDPRVNLSEEKGVHHGQTQIQMGLVRAKTPFKPNYAVIIYTNASWYDQNDTYAVAFDPQMYLEAQNRAEEVFGHDEPLDLLPEGRITGDCKYCPYQNTCYEGSKGRAPKDDLSDGLEAETREEIEKIAREVAELAAEKKAAEKTHKEASERLKLALEKSGSKRAFGDDWKASYTFIGGKRTLSKNLMTEAGLDPEDFMEEGRGYSKITVSVSK